MKTRFFLIVTVVVFVLVGCAHYSLITPRESISVADSFSVKTNIAWSMAKENGLVIWTADGPVLQELIFFPGIVSGSPLIKIQGQDSKKMPTYGSSMTFLEIVDLIEATFSKLNFYKFEKQNLKPQVIGEEEGFRFDFTYVSKEGLDYKGFAAGAIKNQKLYLVLYTGTSLHYFEKYASEADYIINNLKIL